MRVLDNLVFSFCLVFSVFAKKIYLYFIYFSIYLCDNCSFNIIKIPIFFLY